MVTCPWGIFSYSVLPFGLCNALATFQRAVLSIFFDIAIDCDEIYMDDFTNYGGKDDSTFLLIVKSVIS